MVERRATRSSGASIPHEPHEDVNYPRRRSDPGARDPAAPGVNRAIMAIASGREDSSGNIHYLYPGDEGYDVAIAAWRARIAADDAAAARERDVAGRANNNQILGAEDNIPPALPAVESFAALMDRAHAFRNN